MFRGYFLIGLLVLASACNEPEKPVEETVATVETAVVDREPGTGSFSYELFENIDSAGAMHGVGYDIYDGNKRIIHQVNIPGEPGTDGFINRDEAGKVASLVIMKLASASGFPTISRSELDSLGITLQTAQ